MPVTVNGVDLKVIMENETPAQKKMIIATFCIQSLVWTLLTICWGIWMHNADRIDREYSKQCEGSKTTLLFHSCDISYYDTDWMSGPFPSDTDESLFNNAEDYCDF